MPPLPRALPWAVLFRPFGAGIELAPGTDPNRHGIKSCALVVLLLCFLAGCTPTKLITHAGKYPSADKKYELLVTIDNGFAFYEIRAAGVDMSLAKGRVGSVYHKFFLMWDEKNNVWIDGEDTARVIFFEDGKFRTHDKTVADYEDPDFPKAPAEWYGPGHR
jgi:hypothetical protein